MSTRWPMVPLGELLVQDRAYIDAPEPRVYPKLSVKLYGKGVVLDAPADGSLLKMKRHQVARSGQVILSEIWGKKGAVGFVPPEGDSALCTNHFFLFDVRTEKLEPGWLRLIFQANHLQDQLDAEAKGTTGYAAVRPAHLFAATIPLPPLDNQRRVVTKIDAVARAVAEARGLRSVLSDCEMPTLRDAIFRKAFQGEAVPQNPRDKPSEELVAAVKALKARLVADKKIRQQKPVGPILDYEKVHPIPLSWQWVRLGDLCSVITDGTHLTPQYVDEGSTFLSAQNIKPYRFMPENHRKVPHDLYVSCVARAKPERGDILMTRVGAMIGEAAIIDQDLEFAYYVSLCLLKPFKDHVCVPYLLHWLNSPYGAASTRGKTLGRGHSQGNLNLNLIRQFVVPLPPLEEQYRVAEFLDNVQANVDRILLHQSETAAELAAMLPAILDQAFKGEL